ncbi:MAG: HAD-IIB family hydrolase [Muribaculaceae bacterium]|jgi:Cof subfamily protein (haloacid dehalogenase superfamily)|nr:HAD-IIB family hydrolase [Muribaculaceae bacterium]
MMVSNEQCGPTLYVSDLDGTLLGEDSQLSAVTVATLNRIIGELGGLFTVATARTPATVVPLMQQVHARLPFIVIGGSAMWNPVTMSYEHTRGIDDMTVNAVADVFDRRGAHPFIYRRHGKNLLHTHHYGPLSPQEERFIAERQHLPLKQFFLDDRDFRHSDDEALLIFSMNKYAVLKSIADDLRTSVPTCSVMVYHDIFDESEGYLEIFSAGTSKAAAIRDLARQLGAGRVVVFGDNRNDIAMMQAADFSVAVDNAFTEVKAVASEVIGPNTADSVARWIETELLHVT